MQEDEGRFRGSGGVEIAWRRWFPADGGPAAVGDTGGAPVRGTVVISHGLAEHSGRYHHVAERLVAAGFDVWAPDHRGHGRSGGRRVYVERFATFAADLETLRLLAADRRPGPQFLVGHSMGGAVALRHAIDRPWAWSGLVLSGPAVEPGSDANAVTLALARLLARLVPRMGLVTLDSASVCRDPAVVAAYDGDPLVHRGRITVGLGGQLLAQMRGFGDGVARLTVPVLVLVGTEDTLVEPDGVRRLFPRIASADKRLVEYPGLYHEIFNEPERDAVLDDVVAWLEHHC